MSDNHTLSHIGKKNKVSSSESIKKRLRQFRSSLNLTQTALAKELGTNQSTYSNYENRGTVPPEDILRGLSRLGLNIHWLLTGEQEMLRDAGKAEAGNQSATEPGVSSELGNGVRVPKKLVSVRASAGAGYVIEEEEIGTYYVDPSELPVGRRLKNGLYVVHVEGESMKPEFRPNEPLIFEPILNERQRIHVDSVYHFRLEDSLYIKRLQRLPGYRIRVLSRNEEYPDFEIKLDAGIDFEIHGKLYARFERY